MIASATLDLGADPQRGQDFDTRPIIAVSFQAAHETVKEPGRIILVANLRNRDDRQETVREQLAHATQRTLKRPRPAKRIILLRGVTIDRYAEFEAVIRRRFRPAQAYEPFLLEDRTVGQHGGQTIVQGQL